MFKTNKVVRRLLALVLVTILVAAVGSGCAKKPVQEIQPLTLGLLPIVDSLPFLVAAEKGYYEAEGLAVELEYFKSALDRDSAFQAGKIDGGVADLIAAASLAGGGLGVKVLSISLGVTPQEGRFAILVPPGSPIASVNELKGVEIAVSPNTIIEFTTDMMLRDVGLKPAEIVKTTVADIPVRFQLLMEGKIQAANLPDPLAALAETNGARVIVDDTQGDNISQSVILFTTRATVEKPESIKAFFRAYNRAVQDIAADPEAYRPMMEEKLRLPEGLSSYKVTPFSPAVLPQKADVDRVVDWLLEKGTLKERVDYEELVNGEFLPY